MLPAPYSYSRIMRMAKTKYVVTDTFNLNFPNCKPSLIMAVALNSPVATDWLRVG